MFASALGLALMLIVVSQMSSAREQQDTHKVTPPPVSYNDNGNENKNGRIGIPYNTACRNRCNRDYRRCVRRGGSNSACRRQLRRCLQRCPQ
jgi:hypothetical protein